MLENYPTITYENVSLKDISVYYNFYQKVLDKNNSSYTWYTIKDWISPENLAYNFYGSCDYVWVIFAMNNIVNPVEDWLLPYDELEEYINKKYGKDVYKIRYYEYEGIRYTNKKFIPFKDKTFKGMDVYKTVTNHDYEVMMNDRKRYIKILKKIYISTIKEKLEESLRISYV